MYKRQAQPFFSQDSLDKPRAAIERTRARSERPRQGRFCRRCSSERAVPAKILPFEHSRGIHILRSRTDLAPHKFDVKQIFPDTARQPQPPAHIKEQTDERISQTIVRIQSNQAKREIFPGLSVSHLDRFDAPAENNIAWAEDISVSTSHMLPKRRRERAASGPRQGRFFIATSSEKELPAKILSFQLS